MFFMFVGGESRKERKLQTQNCVDDVEEEIEDNQGTLYFSRNRDLDMLNFKFLSFQFLDN